MDFPPRHQEAAQRGLGGFIPVDRYCEFNVWVYIANIVSKG